MSTAPASNHPEEGYDGAAVALRTPYGQASGRLSDRDPWGRYRITGTGRPPFPTA